MALTAVAIATQAAAQVTFYEREGFQGESFTTRRQIANFERFGFNDRASSVVVAGESWERWQVCEDVRFGGPCVVLRPGQYPSLRAMGLNNRISSVQALAREDAPAIPPTSPGRVVFYENCSVQSNGFSRAVYRLIGAAAGQIQNPPQLGLDQNGYDSTRPTSQKSPEYLKGNA